MKHRDKRPSEGFWEAQALASFQEIDQLSKGIRRIYDLLGYERNFVSNVNPAHHELAAIIADLEKGKLP